ncbi:MAG: Gfo/Idh/MocA family protein [Chthoniobacteraceae bacterium]
MAYLFHRPDLQVKWNKFMSISSSVPFALIGAGGIGAVHLSTLRRLHSEGKVQFIAVADPFIAGSPVRRELEALGIRWYSDYCEMLKREKDLKAVTISTPISLHFSMVRECLERDLFILLEKPPVPLIQQLDQLIELDTHNRVAVGFQMIYAPALKRMKQSIAAGDIGEIEEIRIAAAWPRTDSYYNRARWAGQLMLDGEPVFDGPATNGLAHLIHNAMYLAAQQGERFAEPHEIQGMLYRARQIAGYDVASFRGLFASGTTFTASLTHAVKELEPFKIEVRGTEGWVRISDDGRAFETPTVKERFETGSTLVDLSAELYAQFLNAIHGQKNPLLTRLKDARGYVLATNGAWLSSGGIHDIDSHWKRSYSNNGDPGVEVIGLVEQIEDAFAAGQLLSEQNIPWAYPSRWVSTHNLRNIQFPETTPIGLPAEHVSQCAQ